MRMLDPIEACQRLIAALEGRVQMSPHLMASRLEGWEFMDIDGAVVMRKGPELHAAAAKELRGHWITRRSMRAVIGETLQRFGHVVTSVSADNSAGHAFVQRLGFKETGGTPSCTFYELRKCRHA